MTLSSIEHAELVEHLRSRPDIWTESNEAKFFRLDRDPEGNFFPIFALLIASRGSGPLRTYSVSAVSLRNDDAEADSLTRNLVEGFTSYNTRVALTHFFMDELKLDSNMAVAASIAATKIVYDGELVPTGVEDAVQGTLPGMPEEQRLLYGIAGGGYLALRLQGNAFRAEASLRDEDRNGFLQFRGWLRPVNGTAKDAETFLRSLDFVPEPETAQQELPLEGNSHA